LIFKRDKKQAVRDDGPHVMRGRDGPVNGARPAAGGGGNPLARRFQADDEPDTVDLLDSDKPDRPEDPATRDLSGGSRAGEASAGQALVRFAEDTGKFYLLPGSGDSPVRLNGTAVAAATELRPGDCIEAGDFEFRFQPARPE
jgi:hypothetical protein